MNKILSIGLTSIVLTSSAVDLVAMIAITLLFQYAPAIAQSCPNYWTNPATGKAECLSTQSSQVPTQEQDAPEPSSEIGGGYTYLGQLENTDKLYVKLGKTRKRYGYTEVLATVRVIEQSSQRHQTLSSMIVNCDRKEITLKTIHRFKPGQNIDFHDYGAGLTKPVTEGNDSGAIWEYACGNK